MYILIGKTVGKLVNWLISSTATFFFFGQVKKNLTNWGSRGQIGESNLGVHNSGWVRALDITGGRVIYSAKAWGW